jgi:uncharacterized membrane protein (DUF485 family)
MSNLEHVHRPGETADTAHSHRHARLGLALFGVYTGMYATFMALNAFIPWILQRTVWGINLALYFGLGLIVVAFLLALTYAWLCRVPRPSHSVDRRSAP